MTRPYIAMLLLAIPMASGCVGKPAPSRPIFYKPGVTSSQIEADEAQCVVLAIGGSTEVKPLVTIDREAVYQCMAARGYEVRRPKA